MGKVLDITKALGDRNFRGSIRADIEALIENYNGILPLVDNMSEDGLTALGVTNDVTVMSRCLQMLMMQKQDELDIDREYALETLQKLMDSQMMLGLFYADRLGISAKEVFPPEAE